MSRRASDAVLVDLKLNVSPLSGSRGGSLCTSLQTSDIKFQNCFQVPDLVMSH